MRKSKIHNKRHPQQKNAGFLRGLFLAIILSCPAFYATQAQVGVHTDFPDASSAMEIYSTNRGLLIPRLTLTSDLTSPSPVTSPAVGLLIFNNGSNQPIGFYYWDGSQWQAVGSGGSSDEPWLITGNSGTSVSTNFLGTTDNVSMAFRTNNTERMRIENDGQVTIGTTTPYYSSELVTIQGNATNNYALNVYSPYVGLYVEASYSGVYVNGADCGGQYGVVSLINHSSGYPVWSRNYNTSGPGIMAVAAGQPAYSLINHLVGINSTGNDGVFAKGNASNGTGILALGSAVDSVSTLANGSGGAFNGYHGIYSVGSSTNGMGVIGLGNNYSSFSYPPTGCGGAFNGYNGIYGRAGNSDGIGLVGLGSGSTAYLTSSNGIGASLGGYYGVAAQGQNITSGVGVIGAGNNTGYSVPGTGCGGAFTATYCGVYGYALATSGDHYGGYFAAAGNSNQTGYAYVGGRFNNTQCKIIGTGTVNTIVKNRQGEQVALTCPEAPEMLFQDYGVGQLVNGVAHIEIDPDLAINIDVSEERPLKVFITPEGDCNGVYVTNKSANGFDVIELMGGQSNIPFSWQIVATRANEFGTDENGSRVLVSDYSYRFPPAPKEMETVDPSQFHLESVELESVEKSAVKTVDDLYLDKNETK